MKISHLRLKRVRFKDGRTISVLRPPVKDSRIENIKQTIIDAIDGQGDDVGGFAFVVWGATGKGNSISIMQSDGRIPSILVPDFVRNRLLAEVIEKWTIDSLTESPKR